MSAGEPSYEVLFTDSDYEILSFPSYVVAEMTVEVDKICWRSSRIIGC